MNYKITKEHQEALDRLVGYITNYVGSQDWEDHIYNACSYVAAALGMDEMTVVNYLRTHMGMEEEK